MDAILKCCSAAAALFVGAALVAQEPPPKLLSTRYSIEYNPINFPQKTPQEAMKSIAKAIDNGRFEYMLAHLVDPNYVDGRVQNYLAILVPKAEIAAEDEAIAREPDIKERRKKMVEKDRKDRARRVVAFNRLVVETRKNFEEDPVLLKELRLFAKNAEWEADDERAAATIKAVTPRRVTMKKKEDRWFMDERYQ